MRKILSSVLPAGHSGNHLKCPLCDAEAAHALVAASSGTYRHCGACDLVFQEPAQWPDAATERAQYMTHENRVDDPRYRAFLAQLADPLCARLPPGAAGLDYGAGPGPALAAMLAEAGFPTAVYDPYFATDTAPLTRRYDFITCTEVIEHMHAPAVDFARFATMLRPGGWLGLMTELRPPLAEFAAWYYHRDPTHVCFYSADTMRWVAHRYRWVLDVVSPRVVLLRAPGP